ncbi:MAG: hypothetical protein K6T83_01290 [Alicyclobacillus sp.]|nr:hypothetical protein [Alicyclobacillus sp.]
MPYEDVQAVLSFAQQVLTPAEYQRFQQLIEMRESDNLQVRAAVNMELLSFTARLKSMMMKSTTPQLHLV